jgi:hypothetical protein
MADDADYPKHEAASGVTSRVTSDVTSSTPDSFTITNPMRPDPPNPVSNPNSRYSRPSFRSKISSLMDSDQDSKIDLIKGISLFTSNVTKLLTISVIGLQMVLAGMSTYRVIWDLEIMNYQPLPAISIGDCPTNISDWQTTRERHFTNLVHEVVRVDSVMQKDYLLNTGGAVRELGHDLTRSSLETLYPCVKSLQDRGVTEVEITIASRSNTDMWMLTLRLSIMYLFCLLALRKPFKRRGKEIRYGDVPQRFLVHTIPLTLTGASWFYRLNRVSDNWGRTIAIQISMSFLVQQYVVKQREDALAADHALQTVKDKMGAINSLLGVRRAECAMRALVLMGTLVGMLSSMQSESMVDALQVVVQLELILSLDDWSASSDAVQGRISRSISEAPENGNL